jgi:hypothetical protein
MPDEQTMADRDRSFAEADQTGSERDQTAAVERQAAADIDQAASDRDLAYGGDRPADGLTADSLLKEATDPSVRKPTAYKRLIDPTLAAAFRCGCRTNMTACTDLITAFSNLMRAPSAA